MGAHSSPVPAARAWGYVGVYSVVYALALLAASLLTGEKLAEVAASSTSLPPAWRDAARDAGAWLQSWAPMRDMPQAERLQLLLEENQWKNDLVMWVFPPQLRAAMPHFVQTWVRCGLLCAAVYMAMSCLWTYYIYYCFGDKLFQPGKIPAFKDVFEQLKVSFKAMPLYSMLPAVTELFAEQGMTLAYPRVDNYGLPLYCAYFCLYMVSVEFGVYWMHRGLHEIKWAYKWLHHEHHKYNKEHTLSPFAGLAFHPLDGMLQAVPYTATMMFCPMHFLTHEILLFFTGVWTTNIHDCLHGKVHPIMGAGYHSIHHTSYKHNYGHYFIYMDQLFGTMLTPEEEEEERQQQLKQQQQPTRAASPATSESGSQAAAAGSKAVKAH